MQLSCSFCSHIYTNRYVQKCIHMMRTKFRAEIFLLSAWMAMDFLSSSICSSPSSPTVYIWQSWNLSILCVQSLPMSTVNSIFFWILHSESVLLSEIISLAPGVPDRLILVYFFLHPALANPKELNRMFPSRWRLFSSLSVLCIIKIKPHCSSRAYLPLNTEVKTVREHLAQI